MQYAKLMLDYDHGRLPKAFENVFTKISDIHTHRTRSSVKGNLVQNFNSRTKTHGDKMFKNQGVVIFNEIIRKSFISHLKKHLVSKY